MTVSWRRVLGQSMTEYAIIVALIAISGISAFRYFGGVQRSQMAAITQELAGQESGDMLDLAQSYASKARNDASRDKGLGDYYAGGGSSGGGGSGPGGGTGSGGWLPPIGGGGWTPPGGGILPPPGGGGGGMCPASTAKKASGTMYVWAAKSEEECREWVEHFRVPGLVSPLTESEKSIFEERITVALPIMAKLITALSGDGASLSAEQKALRERIAQFYGLSGSSDMHFSFFQSMLIPLIEATKAELEFAKRDSSDVFRQKNITGHDAMYQDGKIYLNQPFWDFSAKEQAGTIVHEYSHKVGMVHDGRMTLEAAVAYVESRRLAVLHMPPWSSERDSELEMNIKDTYFLEVLFLRFL